VAGVGCRVGSGFSFYFQVTSVTQSVYRILDASLNRVGEGLRTIEEYARFVIDHASFSARTKRLRHDVTATAALLSRFDLISARDTGGDVGVSLSTPGESRRNDMIDVLAAAIGRTGQSMRCLEEYGKTIDTDFAAEIEKLRYRFYTLAADLERVARSGAGGQGVRRRRRMDRGFLYVLIDAMESDEALAARIRALAAAGVDLFQLRDRGVEDRILFQRSLVAGRVCRDTDTLFIVNDRADIAAAADADGVHVGQEELPAAAARKVIGPDRLLGISTHDLTQATEAVRDGADCIGCGPVFAGQTKTFSRYVGPEMIGEVMAAEPGIPVFAIGGVGLNNVEQVLAVGCHRVAVTGAIRDADDPAAAADRLKRLLRSLD